MTHGAAEFFYLFRQRLCQYIQLRDDDLVFWKASLALTLWHRKGFHQGKGFRTLCFLLSQNHDWLCVPIAHDIKVTGEKNGKTTPEKRTLLQWWRSGHDALDEGPIKVEEVAALILHIYITAQWDSERRVSHDTWNLQCCATTAWPVWQKQTKAVRKSFYTY